MRSDVRTSYRHHPAQPLAEGGLQGHRGHSACKVGTAPRTASRRPETMRFPGFARTYAQHQVAGPQTDSVELAPWCVLVCSPARCRFRRKPPMHVRLLRFHSVTGKPDGRVGSSQCALSKVSGLDRRWCSVLIDTQELHPHFYSAAFFVSFLGGIEGVAADEKEASDVLLLRG